MQLASVRASTDTEIKSYSFKKIFILLQNIVM